MATNLPTLQLAHLQPAQQEDTEAVNLPVFGVLHFVAGGTGRVFAGLCSSKAKEWSGSY